MTDCKHENISRDDLILLPDDKYVFDAIYPCCFEQMHFSELVKVDSNKEPEG